MIEQENSFLPVLRFYLIQATQYEVFLSFSQLKQQFPEFTLSELEQSFDQYQSALDKFGVDPPQHNREDLTYSQLRWLEISTNPHDSRTLKAMFDDKEVRKLGITAAKHRVWLTQPAFKKAYTQRMKREASNSAPEVLRRTTQKAMGGDLRAIETFFKLGGRKIPSQLEIEAPSTQEDPFSSRERIVQAMQKVLPPELIKAVAQELSAPREEDNTDPT